MSPRTATVTDDLPAAAVFSIRARAEPGVMPRVLELFAKRGLMPSLWHSAILGPERQELTIDIEIPGLDRPLVDYIAACMRQIVSVEVVLTSERRQAAVG
jgi:acetolactate synthase small subunit